MNANANTVNTEKTEQYAWVDALLEQRALQEQRDYEDQAQEEANPEWNEDGAEDEDVEEDDYMEHCEHCNAGFDTDRQLGYHQMVCIPGNNELCADFLGCPPPLTRQNACFLTEVVDELTGDISLVETDCYGRMEVEEPDEDLLADASMEDDGEDQDQALYDLKRYCQLTFAPFKKQKTYHEHPIPEPMDICDSEEDADAVEADDYMSENDELEPRQLFNDDNDEEEEDLLSVMSDIEVEPIDDNECNCGHDVEANEVCYDCIWFLEQEAHRRFPRRAAAQAEEDPDANIIFPEFDNDGNIRPIPMEIDDEDDEDDQMLDLGPAPSFQRANTSWVDPQTNEIVHNGNPNGSRFYNEEDNLAEERYHSNVYELEVTYGNGQNVHNRDDAERVAWLINEIEEYNKRDQHKF